MADVEPVKARRSFRKYSYRGVELEALLDLSNEDFVELVHARARRRFQRGLKRKPMALIKKLRKAKKEAPVNEKPAVVKTHLRNMIIVPEMIGSVIGIYNGKTFNAVEIKPEMVGYYLAEFSISYKPVRHGRPGIGAQVIIFGDGTKADNIGQDQLFTIHPAQVAAFRFYFRDKGKMHGGNM